MSKEVLDATQGESLTSQILQSRADLDEQLVSAINEVDSILGQIAHYRAGLIDQGGATGIELGALDEMADGYREAREQMVAAQSVYMASSPPATLGSASPGPFGTD